MPRGRINAENAAAVEEDCALHTECTYTIHITQHTGETSTQLYSSTWYTLRAARCSQDRGALHYCGQQVVRCTGAGQSKGGDGTLGGDNEEAGFNIIPPSSNQPTNPTTPAANALPSFFQLLNILVAVWIKQKVVGSSLNKSKFVCHVSLQVASFLLFWILLTANYSHWYRERPASLQLCLILTTRS